MNVRLLRRVIKAIQKEPRRQAKVAVERIEHFIETEGWNEANR